jgi:hypothetical protein
MLRQIVSVSLVVTACAAFIPTKVNAATLTIRPTGQIQQNPGDLINFTFKLKPETGNHYVIPRELTDTFFDPGELEEVTPLEWLHSLDLPLTSEKDIAVWRFKVLNPFEDGAPDVSATLSYDELTASIGLVTGVTISASGGDVIPVAEPVPEPLTMFGAAAALGYGAILKQKYSKKTES